MDVLKELNALGIRATRRGTVEEQKRKRDEVCAKRKQEKQVTYMGTCTQMMKDQFKEMLRNFDWTYDYSDDPRVWKRGSEAKARMDRLARMYPELAELYEKHRGGRGL